MSFCPKCGAPVEHSATFCPKCGTSLQAQPASPLDSKVPSDGRWLIALLLCFFLGCLGIHRFYVGKTGSGIAMLLTCGGCGIWALVDFIMILVNSFTDKDGRPLK
ncbi:MAG: TM2 domain-containing protein [Candidatus Cryptobacteroides sp.]|nr:TM2 domain-containing protein [Candidatus Cryptobacteroides sp.]